jgi:nitroreductase
MEKGFLDFIKGRKSVRHFKPDDVDINIIYNIIEAARWAPSGLNNQPWKFMIVKNKEIKEQIGNLSHYKRIFIEAPVLIPFFLDTSSLYHREKDIMGLGAAIENILLAIEALGLGGVWLGEIIKAREKVEEILSAHENSEFFGVVALGYPNVKKFKQRKRKELSEIIEKEFL